MNQARLSQKALSDLDNILDYINQDNEEAAARILRAIHGQCNALAASPLMGRSREQELGPRIRSFPIGRYVIFYRPVFDGVEIIRVLHGAQDIQLLFE